MPSQLIKNEGISFICARTFVYAGETFEFGTDFPQEKATGRIEALVRTRYVIPVVETTAEKPRHWHRHVQPRAIVLAKLGLAPTAGEDHPDDPEEVDEEVETDELYDPADYNVDEVLEYLTSEDITEEESARVLAAEKAGKARKGILGDEA